jgi:hypothetical protein
MPSFAIIAEGVTDQAVIENILQGFFQMDDELVVNHVQPPRELKNRVPAPGGWTLVFQSLRNGDYRKSLQFNDYVVIHIDTDVSEETGFDVSHRAPDGNALSPEELIKQVGEKLVGVMDLEFYKQNAGRIVFAIAVDSIECWLMPLLYSDEVAKKTKVTGCLQAADWKLRRLNRPALSKGDHKVLSSYDMASREYMKHKKLMEHCDANPSLHVFVSLLQALSRDAAGETVSELVSGDNKSSDSSES